MKRRDFIKTSVLGTGILMSASILQAKSSQPKKISLNFAYQINFDSAKEVKLWIPMPATSDFQQPSNIKINGNYNLYKTYTQNTAPIVYAQYNQNKKPKHINIKLDVTLKQRDANTHSNLQENPKDFLLPTRYVRTDGIIQTIASQLHSNSDEKTVENIYAWVIQNIKDTNTKNTRGIRKIQVNDANTLLLGENISATTLFVSLCRACKIPATEAFGLGLNTKNTIFTTKAEVYLKAKGWTPYDIITPINNPALSGSQKWQGEFVLLNYERDIKIENAILSSFDNAFGLVDGDRLSYYDTNHFTQSISHTFLS